MTLLVAAVIVHDRDTERVLLLRRGPNAKFAAGMWDLPVGKSEPGEPITATAVRELREETGLIVDPGTLRVAHVIHAAWGVEGPGGFVTIVFATDTWTGEPVNAEPTKHDRVRWADIHDIPKDFVTTTASALDGYLHQGSDTTLHGWEPIRR
ncbi:NUDIX domain-containing protein [Embleya sp. NPDC055664]